MKPKLESTPMQNRRTVLKLAGAMLALRAGRPPGTVARLDVLRDGHRQSSAVKLTERPAPDAGVEERGISQRRPSPSSCCRQARRMHCARPSST